MRFVRSMRVARAGKRVDDYTLQVDEGPALAELLKAPHTLCEFLHDSRRTKLFLDRDAYLEGEDPDPDRVRAEKDEVVRKCEEIASTLRAPGIDIAFVVASRHGVVKKRFKISFRAFFTGFTVVYHDIPILVKFLEQDDFWDLSPYKPSEQLLAAINGAKSSADPRTLTPEPEFADNPVEDFVAQVVRPEWTFLDLDAFNNRNAASTSTSTSTSTSPQTTTQAADPAYIRALVAILSHKRANDRKTWIDVGLALKHAGGATDQFFDLFVEFSNSASDKTKVASDRELRRTWDSFAENTRNPLTVKSIAFWAKTDNPEAYRGIKTCSIQPAGRPLTIAGVLAVMARLKPEQTDLETLRLALKLNERLLRNDNRPREADAMSDLYMGFARAHPDFGDNARDEYERTPDLGGPAAVDLLYKQAGEDDDVDVGAQIKNLLARHLRVDASDVHIHELVNKRVKFTVRTDNGHIDLRDMAVLFKKEWTWILAREDGTRLYHEEFKNLIERYFDHTIERIQYYRHSETQASLEGDDQYPAVTMTNPYTRRAAIEFKRDEGDDDDHDDDRGDHDRGDENETLALNDVEGFTADLRDVIRRASINALGLTMYNNILNYGNFQQNITINNNAVSPEDASNNRIVRLQNRILAHAKQHNLRKLNGYVYTPLPDRPCAFVPGLEYEAFVSALFGQDEELRQSVDSVKKLATFLADFKNLDDFPELVPDRRVISFKNGVLNIKTMEFTDYSQIDETKTIARHHIDLEYTAQGDTPNLDRVLDHQFKPDTKTWLLALLGRMLFNVKEADRWEIALYLFGVAGSGKSLVLQLLQSLFRMDAVANFASEKDGHFALEGLLGAEIVVGSDMPADISKAIDGTELQKMCSGEPIVVNQKGKKQLRIPRWTSPLIFASNYEPAWKNSQDCIGRRLVPFRFGNVVEKRDPLLADKLHKELPNLCHKILTEYHKLVDKFGDKDITQCFPADIKEWGGQVRASSNKLYEFLSLDDDERVVDMREGDQCIKYKISIQRVDKNDPKSPITLQAIFAKLYECWSKERFKNDESVFHDFGFASSVSRVWICNSCHRKSQKNCCDQYDRANAGKKLAILGMHLVATPV